MSFMFSGLEDAEKQANTLGVQYDSVPIEPMFDQFMQQLTPLFKGAETDTTEENLQSRWWCTAYGAVE